MAFWDFLNNNRRYVGNIYDGAKRVGIVLGTFGKVDYNIGRGIYDYIADNQFIPQNYYFTKMNQLDIMHLCRREIKDRREILGYYHQ
jgi:hypothetical protein